MSSKDHILQAIEENEMVLLYFGSNNCSVCVDMRPKIEEMLGRYSKIKGIYVDLDENASIGVSYSIFTMPAMKLFLDGKESITEARHVSITDLEEKVKRYYNLIFD